MNARVRAVLRKELREFRRNKQVVGTMAVLPLIFFASPTAGVLSHHAETAPDAIRAAVGSALLEFFLVPLMLPTVIAGYAVVGEREQGTLEPVLTTPVSREELLTGKALAAIAPSVAMAYALFALFVIVVGLFAVREVVTLVLEPAIVVAIALFTPLLAAFSIWVGLAISARSSDIRVAQQLSALAMLPMVGVLWLFAFRVAAPTVTVAVAGAVLLVVLDLGAWRVVSTLFDRERLLTRYGGT
jgi:ABC-type Na+ efflux pump permease subunit